MMGLNGNVHVSVKQPKKVKSEEFSKNHTLNIMNKNSKHSLYSDVQHKNSAGNNNWNKFLKEQGIIPRLTTVDKTDPPVKRMRNKGNQHTNTLLQNHSNKKLTKVVAIDCEMVGIGEDGREDMLARVSIVNSLGECLYDTFVKPREFVTDYRTAVSGVRPHDIQNGKDFDTVQKEVAGLLHKKIVVGHSLKSDFQVLFLTHPKHSIRDTARFFKETGKGTPSLKKLAAKYLGATIQEGEHNSIQDAQAAVQLYNMYKRHWEKGRNNNINNFVNIVCDQ